MADALPRALWLAACALPLALWVHRRRGAPREPRPRGFVALVGAGPGDAGLLTVRGAALLRDADVVVTDELVDPAVLGLAGPGCTVIGMGKRGGRAESAPQGAIDALLVRECEAGRAVVRLKGGDPLVFGRVWSEVEALRAAGCEYEIVPGVTSALSAAAAVGIPITHKDLSRHFVVVSCHKPDELDFAAFARVDTIVILMGTRTLPILCERLIAAGVPPDTPVALVQWAGRPTQRAFFGTLHDIARLTGGQELSPAVVIVGRVVALAAAAPHPDPPSSGATALRPLGGDPLDFRALLMPRWGMDPFAQFDHPLAGRRCPFIPLSHTFRPL